MENKVTASIVIIGNEILSGRILDKNVEFIAKKLSERGIFLREVRIIPDIDEAIIETVNFLRNKYNYVFTTGGIGPTHDDITSESIAKAFGVRLEKNQIAYNLIKQYYDSRNMELNEAREKMAYIPEGASLIPNRLTNAPGFVIENVYVMAGIPEIMREMFFAFEETLPKMDKIDSKTLKVYVGESMIARDLESVQNKYPSIDIGSYPFVLKRKETGYEISEFIVNDNVIHGTDIVFRGAQQDALIESYDELKQIIISKNYDFEK